MILCLYKGALSIRFSRFDNNILLRYGNTFRKSEHASTGEMMGEYGGAKYPSTRRSIIISTAILNRLGKRLPFGRALSQTI
jgi:hypothetical protein